MNREQKLDLITDLHQQLACVEAHAHAVRCTVAVTLGEVMTIARYGSAVTIIGTQAAMAPTPSSRQRGAPRARAVSLRQKKLFPKRNDVQWK